MTGFILALRTPATANGVASRPRWTVRAYIAWSAIVMPAEFPDDRRVSWRLPAKPREKSQLTHCWTCRSGWHDPGGGFAVCF